MLQNISDGLGWGGLGVGVEHRGRSPNLLGMGAVGHFYFFLLTLLILLCRVFVVYTQWSSRGACTRCGGDLHLWQPQRCPPDRSTGVGSSRTPYCPHTESVGSGVQGGEHPWNTSTTASTPENLGGHPETDSAGGGSHPHWSVRRLAASCRARPTTV